MVRGPAVSLRNRTVEPATALADDGWNPHPRMPWETAMVICVAGKTATLVVVGPDVVAVVVAAGTVVVAAAAVTVGTGPTTVVTAGAAVAVAVPTVLGDVGSTLVATGAGSGSFTTVVAGTFVVDGPGTVTLDPGGRDGPVSTLTSAGSWAAKMPVSAAADPARRNTANAAETTQARRRRRWCLSGTTGEGGPTGATGGGGLTVAGRTSRSEGNDSATATPLPRAEIGRYPSWPVRVAPMPLPRRT